VVRSYRKGTVLADNDNRIQKDPDPTEKLRKFRPPLSASVRDVDFREPALRRIHRLNTKTVRKKYDTARQSRH
jgi:hypothetical protein